MRRLADAREHLDGALADRAVLVGNLRDLRRVNRWLGGTRLSVRAIRGLVGEPRQAGGRREAFHILDVGTGAADIPVALLRARWPLTVRVTAVDSRQEVVDAAVALTPELESTPGLTLAVADGRSLPFVDGSFDVAHASLVLHHLDPADAVAFLRELMRVSRRGVVVNDLQRSTLGWLGGWLLLHLITRNSFTLHDGPLSVRRAYTKREAFRLLADAGLRPVVHVSGFAGHRWAMGAVRADGAPWEAAR